MPDEPIPTGTRSGVDDALTWHLFATAAQTPDQLIGDVLTLPADAILVVDDLPETWMSAIKTAGLLASYSPLDLGWLIAGPKQRERAGRRHVGYRVHGVPG